MFHLAHKICSPELFANEVSHIKLLLNKNGYPQEMVNKTISNHTKNLNKRKLFGPQKCVITLKLPFINRNSIAFEKNIKQIIRSSYFAAKPRIIFTSTPLATPGGKDPIPKLKKSIAVYQFDCFCKTSYIGMTSRQLIKKVRKHIQKSIESYSNSEEKE